MEESGSKSNSMESRPAMTTEISNAARVLADSFMPRLLSKSCHRDCGDITNAELAAHIQSALTAARNSGLEDAAIMADATCYEKVAKGIRAMKVQI